MFFINTASFVAENVFLRLFLRITVALLKFWVTLFSFSPSVFVLMIQIFSSINLFDFWKSLKIFFAQTKKRIISTIIHFLFTGYALWVQDFIWLGVDKDIRFIIAHSQHLHFIQNAGHHHYTTRGHASILISEMCMDLLKKHISVLYKKCNFNPEQSIVWVCSEY